MKQCLIYSSGERAANTAPATRRTTDDTILSLPHLDSTDKADAKLLGIEYLVTEEKFKSLPAQEKPYWHSHKHEVASGLLCALNVAGPAGVAANAATKLPGVAPHGGLPDELEKGPMMEIYKMYGKTVSC